MHSFTECLGAGPPSSQAVGRESPRSACDHIKGPPWLEQRSGRGEQERRLGGEGKGHSELGKSRVRAGVFRELFEFNRSGDWQALIQLFIDDPSRSCGITPSPSV